MEALGDLLRWWKALSQRSRMAYATASVIVAVALGVALYQGYCGPAAPTSSDGAEHERGSPATLPASVFSLPLPGTTRRRQAETAQLLESVLGGYDYIASTQTTFAAGLSEIETTNPLVSHCNYGSSLPPHCRITGWMISSLSSCTLYPG